MSYNERHNDDNGEGGNDGESNNRSWNSGAEGPTDDESILDLRLQRTKNMMATLLLSQGVPMILHGDELGRTQMGNNNVYCQDNEISWMNWEISPRQQEMLNFTRMLIELRRAHPVFRRRRFLLGEVRDGAESTLPDVAWLGVDGTPMTDDEWNDPVAKCLTVFFNGSAIPEPNKRGEHIVDDSALLMFNASETDVEFTVPGEEYGLEWVVTASTSKSLNQGDTVKAGQVLTRPAFTTLVLGRGPLTPPGENDDATSLTTALTPHTSVLTPATPSEPEGGDGREKY